MSRRSPGHVGKKSTKVAKGVAKRVKARQTLDAALKRAVREYKNRRKPFAG